MCISSRIARYGNISNNLSKRSIEFEPGGFLMSVFCIAKSYALILVSDTGDVGWGCGLLPAGKGTQVVVVRGGVHLPIKA